MREQRRIGEPNESIVWRNARHRHRALGKTRHAVAADLVVRDHGLPLSDDHAQSDVVAFRRSDASTLPSRTSTPCETPRTATASAASAQARLSGLDQPLHHCRATKIRRTQIKRRLTKVFNEVFWMVERVSQTNPPDIKASSKTQIRPDAVRCA